VTTSSARNVSDTPPAEGPLFIDSDVIGGIIEGQRSNSGERTRGLTLCSRVLVPCAYTLETVFWVSYLCCVNFI
jgi:hypothetical protein